MTRDYQPHEIAKGRIEIAIVRMVEKYPFHVAILERFKIAARPDVGTMAVTVSGKDILLLHNPQFVLGVSPDELRGSLLHEVHHVLFGHVLADPDDYPDEWARTVAEEITANEFIEEPLFGEPIKLEQFPRLPKMESTDKRYERLKSRVSRKAILAPGDLSGTQTGCAGGSQDDGREPGDEEMGQGGADDPGESDVPASEAAGNDAGSEGGDPQDAAAEGAGESGDGEDNDGEGGGREGGGREGGGREGGGREGGGREGGGREGGGREGGGREGGGREGGGREGGGREGGGREGGGSEGGGSEGGGSEGGGSEGGGSEGGGREGGGREGGGGDCANDAGGGAKGGGRGGRGQEADGGEGGCQRRGAEGDGSGRGAGSGRGNGQEDSGQDSDSGRDAGRGGGGQVSGGQGSCRHQENGPGKGRLPGPPNKPTVGRTVDDHSVWEEARKAPKDAKAAIENVIREAVLEVGWELVPVYIRGPANAPSGNAPGTGLYEEHSGTGKLPWQQLLRRYIGQARQVRPVFNHPPRRFPELVGIIPGKRRQAARPKIMAVIDSSGSMTDDLLQLIDAELARLAQHHVVTIVECDCEIQRVYEYRRRLKTIAGRGGTDFHPPLEKKFLKKHRPDLIVIFTDGQGPAPTKAPPVPQIWCLTPEGEAPVDWGRKIRMEAP